MKWEISGSSGFSVINFNLNQDDFLYAQPKSMLCMTTGIRITSELAVSSNKSKILGAVKNVMAGENFFSTVFTSTKDNEKLTLAPSAIGPIIQLELTSSSNALMITKGAYLAHTNGIEMQGEYAGLKGLISKKGIYLLKAMGEGTIFLSAYGDINEIQLAADEKIAIDNDYVVAFDNTIKYELVTASKSMKDSFLSGEGLVNRYTGPGKILYQTRGRSRTGILTSVVNTLT